MQRYGLESKLLKGALQGFFRGLLKGVIKGDARSLDYAHMEDYQSRGPLVGPEHGPDKP